MFTSRNTKRWGLAGVLAALLALPISLYAQGYSFTFGGADARIAATTITSASISAAYDAVKAAITLTPATTVTASGNRVVGTRGEITLSAGKTLQDGFFSGLQGKFIGTTGTFNQTAAGRIAGVLGQVDTGTLTLTSGQVSAVWADLQGTPTNNSGELFALRVTNSMGGGTNANALVFMYGEAAKLITAAADGSNADWFANASGTGAGECAQTGGVVFTKTVEVNIMGTDYWIGLCTAP